MKTPTLVLLAVMSCVTSAAARAVDLSGEWAFEVQTSQGAGSPRFTFKQDGETLTGRYKGLLGEADLTGTVSGTRFRFSFTGKAQGTDFTVTYEGEALTDDSVKGTMDLGGMANGTFTGQRKK
jgi:hypothetical protein